MVLGLQGSSVFCLAVLLFMSLLLIIYVGVVCAQADGYTIPANRPASARISTTNTFELSNVQEKRTIFEMDSEGHTRVKEGKGMRF